MSSPNFGYHLARLLGGIKRRLYSFFLPFIVRRRIRPPVSIELDVFAYSNEQSLPEQVASIRSFLRHAGRPCRFVVVTDGSHSKRSMRLLERIDPSVEVERRQIAPDLPQDSFRQYLATHATGKQLDLIMGLPRGRRPALYTDSDVLFFAGASDLVFCLQERDVSALYLADCQFAGDERLLTGPGEQEKPVNTGFLLLFRPLDWSLSISRFTGIDGSPTFFTNQTMAHLTMHQNAARPFAADRYVLQLDDQFVFRDRYAGPQLVLRHYVNPVRHKFWNSLK